MFEIGSFQLLNAPEHGSKKVRDESQGKKKFATNLPFSLSSLSPIRFDSFVNSRFDFALLVSGVIEKAETLN
jgi:hypothetical protein